MDSPNLPPQPTSDADPSAEQLRPERDESLDELARISDDAGLCNDELTATRLRR